MALHMIFRMLCGIEYRFALLHEYTSQTFSGSIRLHHARTYTRFLFIFFSRFKLDISQSMINVREHRSFLEQVEQAIDLWWVILTFSRSFRCRTPHKLYIIASIYPFSSRGIPMLPTASRLVEWIASPPTLLASWVPLEPSDTGPCGTRDVNRWTLEINYVR